jgi:hypothetical protein
VRCAWLFLCAGCLIGPQPGFGDAADDSGSTSGGSESDPSPSTGSTETAEGTNGSSESTSGDTDTDGQPGTAEPRGYHARACGFDLDHDGIVGEDEDCTVCDGMTDEPIPGGHAQKVKYIDCEKGVDFEECGAPDAPCRTFGAAYVNVWKTKEDGAAQLMLCFRGTCPGGPYELPNGWTSPVVREPSGSEAFPFEYPGIPTMLVGWDYDRDHEYPPHDKDDKAEIDISTAAGSFLILSGSSFFYQSHDIELAHFDMVGEAAHDAQLIYASRDTAPAERIFLHDIEIADMHAGDGADGQFPIIGLTTAQYMGSAGQVQWLALENIDFESIGGYLFHEHSNAEALENGPIRVKNVSAVWNGCSAVDCGDAAVPVLWRTSGYFEKVEIIDSSFDGNTESWDPFLGDEPDDESSTAKAIVIGGCNRDFVVRNNEFRGFATAVRVEANTTGNPCTTRDVTGIQIENNAFVGSGYTQMARMTVPFYVGDRTANGLLDRKVGDVRIVNNAAVAEHGWLACAGIRVSGDTAGPIVLEHNTCVGALADQDQGSGHLWVRLPFDAVAPLSDLVVRNMLFAGASPGDIAMLVTPSPPRWSADNNAFDPDAAFVWSGNALDFAGWQAMSGGDAASRQCVAEFVAAGDVHLADDDACAAENGVVSSKVTDDIDGDDRPMGPSPDIGADERR